MTGVAPLPSAPKAGVNWAAKPPVALVARAVSSTVSAGAPVADAKVSAQLKGGAATFYVTTGKTGAYRFPFFNGEVNPADVVIACSKPGYKQSRVTRRPVVKKPDGVTPAETECRLEQG